MYLMKDIVRDGDPVLRTHAEKVTFPLDAETKEAAKRMMEYLVVSQDEEANEEFDLRPGVGLAAPQVGISKQFSAILIPDDSAEEDEEETYIFDGVIYNPVIVRESVKRCALNGGEGCLSVDEDVVGFVERANRITVRYQDETGETHEIQLSGYPAIVFQHEIDHLNGVLYYDHIDRAHPWYENQRTRYIG